MSSKGAGAILRSRQRVVVDFYKVTKHAGGPTAFRNALKELISRRGATRRIDVRGERIDVHHIAQHGHIFEGEVGRLRSHDVPAIATRDCATKDIDLGTNESITERTAFLFDSSTGVLAVHTKREAVSASKIADLCDVVMKNKKDYFELQIILAPDAKERLGRIASFKSVEVTYTASATSRISNSDATTKEFLRGLQQTEGQQIKISITSGPKRQSRLSFGAIRGLVAFGERDQGQGVKKLAITGRSADDERLALDLIEERMRSATKIEVVGQSASYETRRAAVRKLYDEQRENF